MDKYKIVLVEWTDSYGCSSGWEETEDLKIIPHHCYSVGYLVKENDEVIVLVPHLSPENKETNATEQGCGDMTIPRVAIKNISFLKRIEEAPLKEVECQLKS